MSFTEHLGELRDRLIRSAIAVAVGVVICYIFSNQIFAALAWPLKVMDAEISHIDLGEGGIAPVKPEDLIGAGVETPEEEPAVAVADEAEGDPEWLTLQAVEPYLVQLRIDGGSIQEVRVIPGRRLEWTILNPMEPIIMKFKIAGYGGLFLALPYILFQLCAFIFPGLKPKERRAARFLIVGCTLLCFAGVLIAYFAVFPFVIPYLANFVPDDVGQQWRMNETVGLIVKGLLGFGIAFQFPMVVLILVYVGILEPATLKAYRKVVAVGLAVVSAVLTPPDPVTMMFMLIPLYSLYELSILMSHVVIRRRDAAVEQA